jgi:hypothetical protein
MIPRRFTPVFIVAILTGYTIMLSTIPGESFSFQAILISQEVTERQGDIYDAQVKQILSEGAELSSQRKLLVEEMTKNDLWEKQLKKEDGDIKAQSVLETKNMELFKNFNELVKKETREYNHYCQGKYASSEYERRKAWCNENEKRIQNDQKKREQIGMAIKQRLTELENRKKKLSEDTLTQFSRKKELNAQWDDCDVNQKDWMSRYRQLMMTPALKDSERRAKINMDCTNRTTLEEARQCLQRIWYSEPQENQVQK